MLTLKKYILLKCHKHYSLINIVLITLAICCQLWTAAQYVAHYDIIAATQCLLVICLFFIICTNFRTIRMYRENYELLSKESEQRFKSMNYFFSTVENQFIKINKKKDEKVAQLERGMNAFESFCNEALEKKQKALEKYGQHFPSCKKVTGRINDVEADCTCEFDKAVINNH